VLAQTVQSCRIVSVTVPFTAAISPPHMAHSCFEPTEKIAVPAFAPGKILRSVTSTVLHPAQAMAATSEGATAADAGIDAFPPWVGAVPARTTEGLRLIARARSEPSPRILNICFLAFMGVFVLSGSCCSLSFQEVIHVPPSNHSCTYGKGVRINWPLRAKCTETGFPRVILGRRAPPAPRIGVSVI
jgi:hypothetical protein